MPTPDRMPVAMTHPHKICFKWIFPFRLAEDYAILMTFNANEQKGALHIDPHKVPTNTAFIRCRSGLAREQDYPQTPHSFYVGAGSPANGEYPQRPHPFAVGAGLPANRTTRKDRIHSL